MKIEKVVLIIAITMTVMTTFATAATSTKISEAKSRLKYRQGANR